MKEKRKKGGEEGRDEEEGEERDWDEVVEKFVETERKVKPRKFNVGVVCVSEKEEGGGQETIEEMLENEEEDCSQGYFEFLETLGEWISLKVFFFFFFFFFFF